MLASPAGPCDASIVGDDRASGLELKAQAMSDKPDTNESKIRCEHKLSINVRWTLKDGREGLAMYCYLCGKMFDCLEVKLPETSELKG